jgi:hypothetical protein
MLAWFVPPIVVPVMLIVAASAAALFGWRRQNINFFSNCSRAILPSRFAVLRDSK